MKIFEKNTKDEIITTIIEHINDDITCSQDDSIGLHFEYIDNKSLRDMYCFLYNYEGHKMIEIQIAWHEFGCFAYRKKVLLIDGDNNYINKIISSYGQRFDEILKMSKNNVEKTLNV